MDHMPIRLLRPGITTSRRFNRLSWIAQSFYVRLLTLVDDYGRFESDNQILRSYCFPLGDPEGQDVGVPSIADICDQLSETGLVHFYESEGKEYLQLLRWKERPRSESKFPAPDPGHLQAFDSNYRQMITSPPSPSPSPSTSTGVIAIKEEKIADRNASVTPCNASVTAGNDIVDNFTSDEVHAMEIYHLYPRKVGRPAALRAILRKLKDFDAETLKAKTEQFAKARAGQDPQFTPHPSTWFNQERFNDDPETWASKSGPTRPRPFDRNAGTANEGGASGYNLETLRKNGAVQ